MLLNGGKRFMDKPLKYLSRYLTRKNGLVPLLLRKKQFLDTEAILYQLL